jgi:cytochrome c oxidase subunit II
MSFAQSMLEAAGPQAAAIEWLWWVFFSICTAVFVIVVLAMLMAVLHRRPAAEPEGSPASQRTGRVIAAAVGTTVVLLFVLLVASVATGRRVQALADPGHVEISLTGQQWWWDVEYTSSLPSQTLWTANEIHIPVGRPVLVKLRSIDVIHSFWVPNLHGKKDLIPGHETTIWIQADREGVFRGQCAEFCGHQHAHMAFYVVAQRPDRFNAWLAQQRRPAREPDGALAKHGRDVFLSGPCVMCHTIRGTTAGSRLGPDLTHIASRLSLAAGTLPNTTGHLAGWITDAQGIKPGNQMPTLAIEPGDLQALVAYLRSLE